jgi:uracil-DNA glycosylase
MARKSAPHKPSTRRRRKSAGADEADLFAEVGLEEGAPSAVGLPGQPPPELPGDWKAVLADEFSKPYFHRLQAFVTEERANHEVLPREDEVFNAFHYTPYEAARVLILGQDPYPTPGNAHGLCFSVRPGVAIPASLKNIFRELHDDLDCKVPNNGYLVPWAKQGVMLLNAVLTVRAYKPNSHQGKGWEEFTDAAIHALGQKRDPMVFVLWGSYAQKKVPLIDTNRHTIIKSAHPSPLSAKNGFFGSRPFSKINTTLRKNGFPEIDWQIPDLPE